MHRWCTHIHANMHNTHIYVLKNTIIKTWFNVRESFEMFHLL